MQLDERSRRHELYFSGVQGMMLDIVRAVEPLQRVVLHGEPNLPNFEDQHWFDTFHWLAMAASIKEGDHFDALVVDHVQAHARATSIEVMKCIVNWLPETEPLRRRFFTLLRKAMQTVPLAKRLET